MADQGPILDAQNPCSPLAIPASKTALLLMDFHHFIMGMMPPEASATVTAAASLREWARSKNMFIIHCVIDVRYKLPPQWKFSSTVAQHHKKFAASDDPNLPGEVAEIAALPDEYVFWRPLGRISCLNSYGIKDFLKVHDIQSLVLAGVATSGCVIDTAKSASEEGFVVTVVKDACADRSVEVHDLVMQKLLDRQTHVVSEDELVKAWT